MNKKLRTLENQVVRYSIASVALALGAAFSWLGAISNLIDGSRSSLSGWSMAALATTGATVFCVVMTFVVTADYVVARLSPTPAPEVNAASE